MIVGAGHAGLAMSACLSGKGIDHVLLERGQVAHSWRTERWDSLRLLTPNWQSRLPGYGYDGDDPDGYRSMAETIAFIDGYAKAISAPVETETTVTSVRAGHEGFHVETDRDAWRCRTVVLASGACNIPSLPKFAADIPAHLFTITSQDYRNPDQLPDGGVLIVGASASGTQIADELLASGRPVTLAVGEHIRAPRMYRGRDLEWWMDQAGVLDERYDEIDDIDRARRVPSLQLTGTPDFSTLDLNALTAKGANLIGRLMGINDGKGQFSGSLRNQCDLSDLKMDRLLDTCDEWATAAGLAGDVAPPPRFEPTRPAASPPLGMDFAREGVKSIVWATGFRPDFSWLEVDVFDRKGRIRHDGGACDHPGLYLMGMQYLRRRKSALIDGAGDDARDLSAHLAGHLDGG